MENSEKVALTINVDKSKSMSIMSITSSSLVLNNMNKTWEQVKDIKYLGSWIDCDSGIMAKIKPELVSQPELLID